MTTQSVTSPRWRPSDRSIKIFTKLLMALLAVVLIVSAIMTVFPFLWSALLSTRDRTEIFGTGISFAIGDSLAANYAKLLEIMPFWQAMFNWFTRHERAENLPGERTLKTLFVDGRSASRHFHSATLGHHQQDEIVVGSQDRRISNGYAPLAGVEQPSTVSTKSPCLGCYAENPLLEQM